MDKETLSNYGWIVICVLVLAVMIALATPFGDYISTAVKSTTQGFFDTNKNALNSTGLINVGDQSFDDKKIQAPIIIRESDTIIPNGAKYTVKATNTILEGNGTNRFPSMPDTYDIYEEGDYIYYGGPGGWNVQVKNTEKTEYDTFISSIIGKPVATMDGTYESCYYMINAPLIPNGVTSMKGAFWNCQSLKNVPLIPDSVTNMEQSFYSCTSLSTIPHIPSRVQNMKDTFWGCIALKDRIITIPTSVTTPSEANGTWGIADSDFAGPSWIKQ